MSYLDHVGKLINVKVVFVGGAGAVARAEALYEHLVPDTPLERLDIDAGPLVMFRFIARSIDGLEIANTSEAGVAIMDSDHVTLQRSHIHHVRYQGIRVSGSDITVIGNEVHDAVLSNENAALEPMNCCWAAAVLELASRGHEPEPAHYLR